MIKIKKTKKHRENYNQLKKVLDTSDLNLKPQAPL